MPNPSPASTGMSLETIVSCLTIVTALYGFFVWLPRIVRKLKAWYYRRTRTIQVSFTEKRILLTDDALKRLLIQERRDAHLGRAKGITVSCRELAAWEKQLKQLPLADQAIAAEYMEGLVRKTKSFQKMLSILMKKSSLDMLSPWLASEQSLVAVAKGIGALLTQGNLADRTKFDLWSDAKPPITFGIFLSSEEKRELLKCADVDDEQTLQGPGWLFADRLPASIILDHVIPRLLLEIATDTPEPSDGQLEKLLLLLRYNVGLG